MTEAMALLAMRLDKATMESPPKWINYKTTEIGFCRLYGIERAFQDARPLGDWKVPQNPPKGWRERYITTPLEEIDTNKLGHGGHGHRGGGQGGEGEAGPQGAAG